MTQERLFELMDKYWADELNDAECVELLINDLPIDTYRQYIGLYEQMRGETAKMTNWKEKTFITKYDDKLGAWVTTSEDLQHKGTCSEHWITEDKEIAAGLSLLDALKFDIGILAEMLEIY